MTPSLPINPTTSYHYCIPTSGAVKWEASPSPAGRSSFSTKTTDTQNQRSTALPCSPFAKTRNTNTGFMCGIRGVGRLCRMYRLKPRERQLMRRWTSILEFNGCSQQLKMSHELSRTCLARLFRHCLSHPYQLYQES